MKPPKINLDRVSINHLKKKLKEKTKKYAIYFNSKKIFTRS